MPAPTILTTPQFLDLSDVTYDTTGTADEWNQAPFRGIEYLDTGGATQTIAAQVVVTEEGSDDMIITDHPVEMGAVINDHAFKRPAELSVQLGWSSAYLYQKNLGDVRAIYEQILELQSGRTPFTVYTGKRTYFNMLISSLRTMTDQRMEFSFMADIQFKEVILVNTNASISTGVYSSPNVADAATNSATLNTGVIQPTVTNIPDSAVQDLLVYTPITP